MTKKRVALDIGITYEMRTENKYPEVVARLTNLGRQVANRMELDLTHRFTFGGSTTYTNMDGETVDIAVGDALALYSSVHKLRGSATTYRNILANNPRVSKGALEGMERLISEQVYNQFGQKVVMPFDVIFSGDDANTVNTIREYLQASADIETSNSGSYNVYKAKYRHVILPLMATTATGAVDTTKRYYWGLASTMYTAAKLGIWEEPRLKMPVAGNNGEDFSTDNWEYGTRGGYGICTVNGAWIKFSTGNGEA